jgi:hypothetical protein
MAKTKKKKEFKCKVCKVNCGSPNGVLKHQDESRDCRPADYKTAEERKAARAARKAAKKAAARATAPATPISHTDLLRQAAGQLAEEIEAKRALLRNMDNLKAEITTLEKRREGILALLPKAGEPPA